MEKNETVAPEVVNIENTGNNEEELAKKEAERQQALKILKTSYEMYEASRTETIEERNKRTDKDGNPIYTKQSTKETIELIDNMQEDIVAQYLQLGGDIEELKAIRKKKPKIDRSKISDAIQRAESKEKVREIVREMQEKQKAKQDGAKKEESSKEEEPFAIVYDEPKKAVEEKYLPKDYEASAARLINPIVEEKKDNVANYIKETVIDIPEPTEIAEKDASSYNENKPKVSYDTVELPSKGECYKNKKKEIKVSHLVAYDENLILSPSLYKNGTFLDHILKNKILDNIDPDDLIQGDRDAIIIWLRAGGYGNEYPVRMTDEKTGKEYDTTVDLSQLKFKKFTLKGDENGYFDYKLPVSGDVIKFRFLTNRDVKRLEELRQKENISENVTKIKDYIREIRSFIEDSEEFEESDRRLALDSLEVTEKEVYEKYEEIPETYFTHDLTNRLIMSTVSVNGITDRKYVTNYIVNMNLKDASEFRKYIINNEPGIDYNVKIRKPDSLGGGYVETFLQLDQFIFVY